MQKQNLHFTGALKLSKQGEISVGDGKLVLSLDSFGFYKDICDVNLEHTRRVVLVTGLETSSTKDKIRLFFINKRACGGGSITNLYFDASKRMALVYYEDPNGKCNTSSTIQNC